MSQTKTVRIQQRVDTTANWESHNPLLLENEIAYEKETGQYKMGDGVTLWSKLPYYSNIRKGNSSNSAILNDTTNNYCGLKVFYIKSIDMENKKIYLSTEHYDLPTVSTEDNTDKNFVTPKYAAGDEFDLIVSSPTFNNGRTHAHFVNTIVNIENNVVTYKDDLPFTQFKSDSAYYSQSFFVSSKPMEGVVEISGNNTAEGAYTIAAGPWSHAEGYGTLAAGRFAHAEGYETRASYGAHAEGQSTSAKGINSHAEGYLTKANNNYAHAEGRETIADGNWGAHAEGYGTIASGNTSHAEGRLTQATNSYAHAEGESTISSGQGSHAEGGFTTAKGSYSHAEGRYTLAHGTNSHAEGNSSNSSINYVYDADGKALSKEEIIETWTNGKKNFAVAFNVGAHIEGLDNVVTGEYSHAEGTDNLVTGNNAHAEGYNTQATGHYAHVEGNGCTSTNQSSHAEGQTCHATGQYGAHAEGFSARAAGVASHAENKATRAAGDYSHAEGNTTATEGIGSHAEGYMTNTTNKASYSHAEGMGTYACSEAQHVQGKYNVLDPSGKYAHIIGDGTAAEKDADGKVIKPEVRKNIHTIEWNTGNAWYKGTVETDGIILRSSTEGSTKKFLLTIDDNGSLKASEIKEV